MNKSLHHGAFLIENASPLTGKASLRVDCVIGEGAFATVYQATDPVTSERMILKVRWWLVVGKDPARSQSFLHKPWKAMEI